MTNTLSAANSGAQTPEGLGATEQPGGLHHVAYVTHDCAATVDFYTRIMGLKLVSVVLDDTVPSTGEPYPYVHLFFELADQSTVAFFESVNLPPAPPPSHPAYDVFNHLALKLSSVAEVDKWAKRLRDFGVDVTGPTEHGIIYSIYFYDPNGIRLELTTDVVPTWREHHAKAASDMDAWLSFKGADGHRTEELVEWIRSRRRQHREVEG